MGNLRELASQTIQELEFQKHHFHKWVGRHTHLTPAGVDQILNSTELASYFREGYVKLHPNQSLPQVPFEPKPDNPCPPHWWGEDNRCRICGLPKPDESRLPTKDNPNHLTPEEKAKAFENYPCLDTSFEDDYASEVATLLDAQDAKTASYYQAKLKEIFDWVDKNWLDSSNLKQWQTFKQKYLGVIYDTAE